MYLETVITIAKLFGAYFLTIILLTAFMFKPLLKNKTASDKFLYHIVLGNIYVINVVFILTFIGRFERISLIVVLVSGAVILRTLLDRKGLVKYYKKIYSKMEALFAGEYGERLFLRDIMRSILWKISNLWRSIIGGNILERIMFLGVVVYLIYLYSYQTLHYVSYAAPDEEVHLYWIQSLIAGKIYPSGIYPHGFHNVCAALIVIFQFKAVSVMRVVSIVSIVLIVTMLYILLKRVCRSPYIAIISFAAFALLDIYSRHATARYQFSVPQEYAMIFLYPMAIFMVEYLRRERKGDLILFGLSFSLTLIIHFYVTIIAGIMCIAIGIGYLHRIFILRNLKRLLICIIMAVLIALAPMVVAYMMGHELEQSMSWALGIIKTEESTQDLDTSVEQEEIDTGTFNQRLVHEVTKYMVNTMNLFYLFVGLLLLTILHALLRIILKKTYPQTGFQLGLGIYGCLILFLILCRPLGLPTIMEAKRAGIFFAYMSAILIATPLEIIYELIEKSRFGNRVYQMLLLCGICTSIPVAYNKDWIRTDDYFYYIQTKGAMIAVNRILDEYEDFKWTIISPVNERSIVLNDGYHYELVDFLLSQENWNKDMMLRIPTKYVFLFIEKKPISRYGMEIEIGDEELTNRELVSDKDAKLEIVRYEESRSNEYYIYQRGVIMSKVYYWANQYRKYFPKEMRVFYEDDEMIVYKITQNEYALNNFAINYGYNTQKR